MASSLDFSPAIRELVPTDVLERLRIVPMLVKNDKLCLIARKPLSDQGLLELKKITGITDFELQLVGDDVIDEYLKRFKNGTLFPTMPIAGSQAA